jgi:hypothetical protein
MTDKITLCTGCNCMTKSIRKSRAKFICGKCGHDKSLGDVYQYELEERNNKLEIENNDDDDEIIIDCKCDLKCNKKLKIFKKDIDNNKSNNLIEILISNNEGFYDVNSGIIISKSELINILSNNNDK